MKKLLICLMLLVGIIQKTEGQKLSHQLKLLSNDTQCFYQNEFCFRDSIYPFVKNAVSSVTYTFSNGVKKTFILPDTNILYFCISFRDSVGQYGISAALKDSSGSEVIKNYPGVMIVRACISEIKDQTSVPPIIFSRTDAHTCLVKGIPNLRYKISAIDVNGKSVGIQIDNYGQDNVLLHFPPFVSGFYLLLLEIDGYNQPIIHRISF